MSAVGVKSDKVTLGTGRALHLDFSGIEAVIASPAMRTVIDRARRVAQTNASVLVLGETGTGKEIVARAIHNYSPRRGNSFCDVNCAGLTNEFSGAAAEELFGRAAGGTLFLDHIDDLSPELQPRLLRLLDGHGRGEQDGPSATRVIASAGPAIHQAVGSGSFRADLFHRLDSVRIVVPPLRERKEAIAPLCDSILRDTGRTLSADALELLREHHWPGNIRELRNAVNKAVLFATSPVLMPEDFAEALAKVGGNAPLQLEEIEERAIFRALVETRGHREKAAAILGISRRTLIRKLNSYPGMREKVRAAKASHIGAGRRG